MSTLGFGDITFESDLGRAFSILVLLSGIFMLLIVLPFAFIRHFYVPLLESKKKNKVPRQVPAGTKGHILICSYDVIASDLTERLKQENIPYYIIENNLEKALENHYDQIPELFGELDAKETYIRANIKDAKLANRVNAQHAKSQPIGQYEDLLLAELPIHNTPLVSKTIREARLRQKFGVSVVGIWKRGKLQVITGDEKLAQDSVLVIIGNKEQLHSIDELFHDYNVSPNPILLIGGGSVGLAAAESLHKNGILVNVIDKDPEISKKLKPYCNEVFTGKASDYELLKKAGILEAPSVLLSTHDDTMNIYLASYCRQLNKELRIVSRISEARNIDIIHKAGANFVLNYSTLGSEAVLSISKDQELTVLGEGITLFIIPTPRALEGKTLATSGIGAQTGLSVIAIKENSKVTTLLSATTLLPKGAEIVMLGTMEMKQAFNNIFAQVV